MNTATIEKQAGAAVEAQLLGAPALLVGRGACKPAPVSASGLQVFRKKSRLFASTSAFQVERTLLNARACSVLGCDLLSISNEKTLPHPDYPLLILRLARQGFVSALDPALRIVTRRAETNGFMFGLVAKGNRACPKGTPKQASQLNENLPNR